MVHNELGDGRFGLPSLCHSVFPSQEIDETRALSEIGILFVEGFETTGHTISWTLFNIVTTPGKGQGTCVLRYSFPLALMSFGSCPLTLFNIDNAPDEGLRPFTPD